MYLFPCFIILVKIKTNNLKTHYVKHCITMHYVYSVYFFEKKFSTPNSSPGNRWFSFFFALFCLGVKMKNPETEAISGFCCKLHFQSAEKEGLFASLMIPLGGASKLKLPFGYFNFPFITSRNQAFFGASVK